VAYGILVAKEVYLDPSWNKWADGWLKGVDSTTETVWTPADATEAAAWAAAGDRALNLVKIAEQAILIK